MKKKELPAVHHLGDAGHFCDANRCRFHLHTHIGRYCISTIGDYYPLDARDGAPKEIGAGRLYETIVFDLLSRRRRWCGIASDAYRTRGRANAGHASFVAFFAKKAGAK